MYCANSKKSATARGPSLPLFLLKILSGPKHFLLNFAQTQKQFHSCSPAAYPQMTPRHLISGRLHAIHSPDDSTPSTLRTTPRHPLSIVGEIFRQFSWLKDSVPVLTNKPNHLAGPPWSTGHDRNNQIFVARL